MRAWCLGALLAACDVTPLTVEQEGLGAAANDPVPSTGRGFVVVSSDYQSSHISLLNLGGTWDSSTLIATGSTNPGLSLDFSGDLVMPSAPSLGSRLFVIDRFPNSVLSSISLIDGSIEAQLDVSTGFSANPHDLVVLPDGRLLVTRYDSNLIPDAEPLAHGGDLLVLDARLTRIEQELELSGSLPMLRPPLLPHPDRALLIGDSVFVVVASYSADYQHSGSSFLVALDAHSLAVSHVVSLEPYQGCAGLSVRADQEELTVVCSGRWYGADNAAIGESGLVGVSLVGTPRRRWEVQAAGLGQSLGFSVAYTHEGNLLSVAYGSLAESTEDRLLHVEPESGTFTELLRSGAAFSLGDVRCAPPLPRCAVTDAEHRAVVLFNPSDPSSLTAVPLNDRIGLPPRWLGQY